MTASPTRGTDPLAPVPLGAWFGAVAGGLDGLGLLGFAAAIDEAIGSDREWHAVAERQRGGLPQ